MSLVLGFEPIFSMTKPDFKMFFFSHVTNLSEEKVDGDHEVEGVESAAPVDDHVQDGEDDPLMFIQVGQVECNYADFDKDDEAEENQVFELFDNLGFYLLQNTRFRVYH